MNPGGGTAPPKEAADPRFIRMGVRAPALTAQPHIDTTLAMLYDIVSVRDGPWVLGLKCSDGLLVGTSGVGRTLSKRQLSKVTEYDAARHVGIYSGPSEPPAISPLLWLLQRASKGPWACVIGVAEVMGPASAGLDMAYLTPAKFIEAYQTALRTDVLLLNGIGTLVHGDPSGLHSKASEVFGRS